MGSWATSTGRGKPQPAVLDQLFALQLAVDILTAECGLTPAGVASVCFRKADGAIFRNTLHDVRVLLNRDTGMAPAEFTDDPHGFTWIIINRPPEQFQSLIADMHAASLKLAIGGFGAQLLCSLTKFQDSDGRRLVIVYLYNRGTFYPFAPLAGQARDNALELRVRDVVNGGLPFEPELKTWFPVWDAPGL